MSFKILLQITYLFAAFSASAYASDENRHAISSDRIIVITDSHGVGRFGEEVARWLRQRPSTQFEFLAMGASAPLQWINNAFNTPCGFHDSSKIAVPEPRACKKLHNPRLSDLWKEQGPQATDERRVTVIALGTNYGMQPAMKSEQIYATTKLIEDALLLSDRCIWVGPPNMLHTPGFDATDVEYKYQIIRSSIAQATRKTGKAPCELIDSRLISKYPKKGGDGVHYHLPGFKAPETAQAAEAWAEGVTNQVETLLR